MTMGYPTMSSTDTRTVDPAMPHHSANGGHEMSDFSWTTVLWLIPLSAVTLLVFFFVSIFWFKSAKDSELALKQSLYQTTELNAYRAKESEILSSYKMLDNATGRVRIPIARAMELIAKENQDKPGRDWAPLTDIYLEGAAFATPLVKGESGPETMIESAVTGGGHGAAPKPAHGETKPAAGHKAEARGH